MRVELHSHMRVTARSQEHSCFLIINSNMAAETGMGREVGAILILFSKWPKLMKFKQLKNHNMGAMWPPFFMQSTGCDQPIHRSHCREKKCN